MLIFGTLGPAGSNHEWVARRYLAFHGLDAARIELFVNFDAAFASLLRGDLQHVIQAAVHPAAAASVGRYRGRAHIIDSFISASQPMGILTRSEVENPVSLGLQMATRDYLDLSRWKAQVAEPSTVDVARGLLEGKYDSGLTLLRFTEEHVGRLRVDEVIGAVVDPWLVYGTQPTCTGGVLAWKDSPAAKLFGGETSG